MDIKATLQPILDSPQARQIIGRVTPENIETASRQLYKLVPAPVRWVLPFDTFFGYVRPHLQSVLSVKNGLGVGDKPVPIARWHRHVAERDLIGIEELLSEEVVFLSPAVHAPQEGRALVAKYLRAAMAVLNNPSFRYTGEWLGDRSAVLEFELMLGDTYVNGVDLIQWNAEHRIDRFKVMMRPLKGLNTVIPLMAKQLETSGP